VRIALVPLDIEAQSVGPLTFEEDVEDAVKRAVFARNFATSMAQHSSGAQFSVVGHPTAIETKNGDVLNIVFIERPTDTMQAPLLVGPLTAKENIVGSTAVFFLQWWPVSEKGEVGLPLPLDSFDQKGQLTVALYVREALGCSKTISWPGNSH
jgi:hypothetical protein